MKSGRMKPQRRKMPLRVNLLQSVYTMRTLCLASSFVSNWIHPRKDLRIEIKQNRPRPPQRNRRADSWIEKVSSSRNGLGVRFSNYFRNFGFKDFLRCYSIIDDDLTNLQHDTNVLELVLDYRHTHWQTAWRILRAPAIPFATNAQAVTGDTGKPERKDFKKGITDWLDTSGMNDCCCNICLLCA